MKTNKTYSELMFYRYFSRVFAGRDRRIPRTRPAAGGECAHVHRASRVRVWAPGVKNEGRCVDLRERSYFSEILSFHDDGEIGLLNECETRAHMAGEFGMTDRTLGVPVR